ncbi:MAG: MaoC family dehydratase [Syntrophales bacterium]
MAERVSLEQFKGMVGRENGLSDWILIDQNRVNRFADATEDHQWIHVDIEQAKKGPFGGTIGHGFLTLSLLPAFAESATYSPAGIKMAINYGLNKVRFLNPVPVGSRVRSRMVLTNIEEKDPGRLLMTITHTIEIEGQEKPACVAESLAMLFF